MEISYLGHASFRLKGKNVTVVTDPYGEKLGKFPDEARADIVTVSHDHFDHNNTRLLSSAFIVNGPGEYEIKGVAITGVATWHDDKSGAERGPNTVYVMDIDGVKLAHLGDLGHKLTEKQLEEMGSIDVVLVPVGGVYTIDAATAGEVVKQVDPWVVIPMHYKQLLAELAGVEEFLQEMGKPGAVPAPKYVISADRLPTELQVVVLERKS